MVRCIRHVSLFGGLCLIATLLSVLSVAQDFLWVAGDRAPLNVSWAVFAPPNSTNEDLELREIMNITNRLAVHQHVRLLVHSSDVDTATPLSSQDVEIVVYSSPALKGPPLTQISFGESDCVPVPPPDPPLPPQSCEKLNVFGFANEDPTVSMLVDMVGIPIAPGSGLSLRYGDVQVSGTGTAIIVQQAGVAFGGMSEADAFTQLHHFLGVNKVIWLPAGPVEYPPTAPTSFYCRFVGPRVILLAAERDPAAPEFARLNDFFSILTSATDEKNATFDIVRIFNANRSNVFPILKQSNSSYLGFTSYIRGNGCLIVPEYGDSAAQGDAFGLLLQHHPGHVLEPVRVDHMSSQRRAIYTHVVSQPMHLPTPALNLTNPPTSAEAESTTAEETFETTTFIQTTLGPSNQPLRECPGLHSGNLFVMITDVQLREGMASARFHIVFNFTANSNVVDQIVQRATTAATTSPPGNTTHRMLRLTSPDRVNPGGFAARGVPNFAENFSFVANLSIGNVRVLEAYLSLYPMENYYTAANEILEVHLTGFLHDCFAQQPVVKNLVVLSTFEPKVKKFVIGSQVAVMGTQVFAVGSPGKAIDMQTLGVFGMMSCSSPVEDELFGSVRSMSPAATAETAEGAIYGNIIIVGGAFIVGALLYAVILWSSPSGRSQLDVRALTRFPSLPFNILMILLQGTMFWSFKQLADRNFDNTLGAIVGLLSLASPMLVLLYVVKKVHATYNRYDWEGHPSKVPRIFLPEGRWLSREAVRADGSMHSSLRCESYLWVTFEFWSPLGVSLIAAFKPSSFGGCATQYFLLGIFEFILAAVVFVCHPLRVPINNYLAVVSSLLLSGTAFSVAADMKGQARSVDAMQVLSAMVSIVGLLRVAFSLFVLYVEFQPTEKTSKFLKWNIFGVPKIFVFQWPPLKKPDGNEVEMQTASVTLTEVPFVPPTQQANPLLRPLLDDDRRPDELPPANPIPKRNPIGPKPEPTPIVEPPEPPEPIATKKIVTPSLSSKPVAAPVDPTPRPPTVPSRPVVPEVESSSSPPREPLPKITVDPPRNPIQLPPSKQPPKVATTPPPKAPPPAGPLLKVWRVEHRNLVLQPPKLLGTFYDGDSYVVLQSRSLRGKEESVLFCWIGSQSTPDETSSVLELVNEIDDSLDGGGNVIHRQVQGNESAAFLQLFPRGLKIISGGIDSGPTTARVFHVSGESMKSVCVKQVPATCTSLNESDAFLIDLQAVIYVFQGKMCSPGERISASREANKMAEQRTVNPCTVEVVSSDDAPPKFWQVLGGKRMLPSSSRSSREDAMQRIITVEGSVGRLRFRTVSEAPSVKPSSVARDHVSIIDLGSHLIIFIGAQCMAHTFERSKALTKLVEYATLEARDKVPMVRVVEGHEGSDYAETFMR